jgi:hypothetical protein
MYGQLLTPTAWWYSLLPLLLYHGMVKHLIGQATAEVVLPRILLTLLEVSVQQEGIHLRHAKQHLEVYDPPHVSLPCVFKA